MKGEGYKRQEGKWEYCSKGNPLAPLLPASLPYFLSVATAEDTALMSGLEKERKTPPHVSHVPPFLRLFHLLPPPPSSHVVTVWLIFYVYRAYLRLLRMETSVLARLTGYATFYWSYFIGANLCARHMEQYEGLRERGGEGGERRRRGEKQEWLGGYEGEAGRYQRECARSRKRKKE